MRLIALFCSNVNIHALEAGFKQFKHPQHPFILWDIIYLVSIKNIPQMLCFGVLISSNKGQNSYEKENNAPKVTMTTRTIFFCEKSSELYTLTEWV